MLTKIKADAKGLYVRCDGCFGRYDAEVYGAIYDQPVSKFKEGQKVSCTHPAGMTIFVKSKPDRIERPEHWKIDETMER